MVLEDIAVISGILITNAAVNVGIYKYFDARINRVYERLDEHKKENEIKFVRRDLCDVMHKNSSENIIGLELRIVNRFIQLEKKVDDSFDMILGILKK